MRVTPNQLPFKNGVVWCRIDKLSHEGFPALDGLECLVDRRGLGPIFFVITAVLLGDISVISDSGGLTCGGTYPASEHPTNFVFRLASNHMRPGTGM